MSTYRYLDVEKHTSTPPDGFADILRDRWWQVHPEKGLVIYTTGGAFSPLCNTNRSVVERMPAGREVRHLDFVWLPHDCKDYA
ncbi:MAG: hypothetical protein GY719_31610 [bacterium]|nr:hypothetical protein [bacterium]